MPAASVFMLSFNKQDWAVQAMASVLAQDTGDFELWVLENSTDGVTRGLLRPLAAADPRVIYEEIDLLPGERENRYVPAMLLNRYYPQANGQIIFYLSDDDLLEPQCVRRCLEFLDEDRRRSVLYFSHKHVSDNGTGRPEIIGAIPAGDPMGAGTEYPLVDSRIDGGQIAHRKSCLDAIERPWFPENPNPEVACHADGLFMQKLAWHFVFHPLPEFLGTGRRTPLSLWTKP